MLELFSDEVLVEKLRSGDEDASLILWQRHVPSCREAVTRIVTDPCIADAVVRRTFARVVREIIDGTDPLAPFCLHFLTTALLEARLNGADEAFAPPVVRAFGKLDRLDQIALWVRLVDGRTVEEMAAAVSVTVDRVAVRLEKAQTRLRNLWVDETIHASPPASLCAWLITRVPVLQAGFLGPDATARYLGHLQRCVRCRTFVRDDAQFPLVLVESLRHSPGGTS